MKLYACQSVTFPLSSSQNLSDANPTTKRPNKRKAGEKRNVISKYPPAIFTYVRFSLHSTPCHASHS